MASKKGKKTRGKDDWEGENGLVDDVASLKIHANNASRSNSEDDGDSDEPNAGGVAKKQTAFALLMDGDDENDEGAASDDSDPPAGLMKKSGSKTDGQTAETESQPASIKPTKKKDKGKKKGKATADEDDLDKLLEELEQPKEVKSKKNKKKAKIDVDDIEFELEPVASQPGEPDVGGAKTDKKLSRKDKKRLEMEAALNEDVEGSAEEVKPAPVETKPAEVEPEEEKAKSVTPDDSDVDDDDEGPKVKTAAEKRKEKKEKDAEKKKKQKATEMKQKAKKGVNDKPESAPVAPVAPVSVASVPPAAVAPVASVPPVSAASGGAAENEPVAPTESSADKPIDFKEDSPEHEPTREASAEVENDLDKVGESGDEKEDGDGKKDKKKKKKKGKDEKEDKDKDKKKKMGNKALEAMKEALKKAEEEKQRLQQIEEDKLRQRQEAEERFLEKARLEKEKKELKKQKEKERIARKKAEGTFVTAGQKQKMERNRQMLENLQQQGVVVPGLTAAGEAPVQKRPKYVDKKKAAKKQQLQTQESGDREATPGSDVVVNGAATPGEAVEDCAEKEAVIIAEEKVDAAAESWEDVAVESKHDSKSAPGGGNDAESSEDEDDEDSDSGEASTSAESSSDEESSGQQDTKELGRERIVARIKKRRDEAIAKKTTDVLRLPIVCVLGHVDTGKTKILDKIRKTNVQDGEAGGITQQIGATMIPEEALRKQTVMAKDFVLDDMKIKGLLVIDTPGHESFGNLRKRGSSLCDIAILVVDIMHGLEPQTIESINLLKKMKTPFIVALNKIDRLYEWKTNPHKDICQVLKSQQANTQREFKERFQEVVSHFAMQSLNVSLFYENSDTSEYISVVPTSAHSGDGMGNLLSEVIKFSEGTLADRLAAHDALECTVMEVKALPGMGTTIDVILVNGWLRVGDTIVAAGTEGPIVSQIRELLKPQPLRELRVKTPYEHFKELKGAQGIKVLAKDMEKALAGLPLLVAQKEDEVDILKDELAAQLHETLKAIKLSEHGVYVQASTLGSLEALLSFLRDSKIPYAGINIGPLHKRDVMKASAMLEHEDQQYAVILAFDVKIDRDAQELADQSGIRIFSADIIYHLFDAFIKFRQEWKDAKRDKFKHLAVFPCRLKILPQFVFNSRNPIVMGVIIESGVLKKGCPLCVPTKEFCSIGFVTSIQQNHKDVETAKKGDEVCIKIEDPNASAPKMYGRHFDEHDLLVSKITRETIDVCKNYFRDDLQKADWQLMVELKRVFQII